MASWTKPSSPATAAASPPASSSLSTSITKKLNSTTATAIPNYANSRQHQSQSSSQQQQQQQHKLNTGATTTTVQPKAAPIILFGGVSPANAHSMARSASPPARSTSPPQSSHILSSSTPSSPIQRPQSPPSTSNAKGSSPSASSPLTSALVKTRPSHAPSILPEDWQQDDDVSACSHCSTRFKLLKRRHHCRNCGLIFCSDCTKYRSTILAKSYPTPVRVCGRCFFALKQQGHDTEGGGSRGSMDMKMQLQATEMLAQSLSVENGQLRVVTASLDRIQLEQQRTIDILVKQDVQQQAIIRQMQGHIQQLQAQLAQLSNSSSSTPSPRMPSHSPPSIASSVTTSAQSNNGRIRSDAFMIPIAGVDPVPQISRPQGPHHSTSALNNQANTGAKYANATFPTPHVIPPHKFANATYHPKNPPSSSPTTRPTSATTANNTNTNTNEDVYNSINSYYGMAK